MAKPQPTSPPPAIDAFPPDAFVRINDVLALVGLKHSTVYAKILANAFPRPVKLTTHASGWRVRDIKAWLADPTGWAAHNALTINE
jgi:predicted DNA-binding transcriptional regulator AlpA